MPTLREYASSSKKSGFYIQAHVGGPHPITLQVTSIAEQIFRKTGYEPDESVPSKLVWAMYDLDLLYTNKSLDPSSVKDVSTEDILRELDLGNRLSETERREVIEYIEDYEGPQKQNLTKLKEELEASTSTAEARSRSRSKSYSEDFPETREEAVSYLFYMTKGATEFRNAKFLVDQHYLLYSLQSFHSHPYVDLRHAELTPHWQISYRVKHPDTSATYWVTDVRGSMAPEKYEGVEYLVFIPLTGDAEAEAQIDGDEVVEFTTPHPEEYRIEDLANDLEWVLPPDPVAGSEIGVEPYNEYRGHELEPIREVPEKGDLDVRIVEIDRISNSGNPVVEYEGGQFLLDRGEPGEQYLAEVMRGQRWKAIAKVVD